MKTRIICLVAVVMASTAGAAAGQDALTQAKTLYAVANYEDALKLLETHDGAASKPEVNQYRALCLLALGRMSEAQREAAAVIEADPFFTPDDNMAPRVVNLFVDVRRERLPSIIRSKFDAAKGLFSAGNRDRARREFESVIRLLDDPVLAGNTVLTDLKIVAEGFVDLAASSPTVPAAKPSVVPAPPTGGAATTATASARVVVTPAEAIQQTIPNWEPRDPFAHRREFVGAVRVTIDENGKVTAAAIERSVHREYDALLLISAERWRYKPATRQGVPLPSEKVVEVRVQTR